MRPFLLYSIPFNKEINFVQKNIWLNKLDKTNFIKYW